MATNQIKSQKTQELSEHKNLCCRFCKGSNIIKRGHRKTENRGQIQRYLCCNCKRRFVPDDGFFRMRNNPQKITLCMDMFYRGVSTRNVQEHLQVFYPHNADHSTILRWLWKYASIISKFTNSLPLIVGDELQVDEIEYHRRKSHKKGKRGVAKEWFIDSIDPETKFMVASEYAKARGSKDTRTVIARAKERTGNQIKIVTTDGLNAYGNVIKKVFGYNNRLKRYNVVHNRVIVSEHDGRFNYPIERLHNNVRARTKVFRGFHGNVKSANLILKGYEVYYNFVRNHQAIGKAPYKLAIPSLSLGINKWLDLIQLSAWSDDDQVAK